MKKVSELYGRHPGADIYVVGTGASLRVFPKEFLADKIVIGLNMAWKSLPHVNYAITIHPDLNIPDFVEGESPRPEITWVTGHRKSKALLKPEQLKYAEENFYFFEYHGQPNTQPKGEPSNAGRVIEWVEKPTGDYLYVWSSISQAGANLAANLGAKNVILVGCDNCSLADNHHAHAQHTRWMGKTPDGRYNQYLEGLEDVRTALRKRSVNLVSLTPFLGLGEPGRQFERTCRELGVPLKTESWDISTYRPGRERLKNLWRKGLNRLKLSLRGQGA